MGTIAQTTALAKLLTSSGQRAAFGPKKLATDRECIQDENADQERVAVNDSLQRQVKREHKWENQSDRIRH